MKISYLLMLLSCALALTGNRGNANAIHSNAEVDQQDDVHRHLIPKDGWPNFRAAKYPSKNWILGKQAGFECGADLRGFNKSGFDICLFFDTVPGPNGEKKYEFSWMDPFGVAAADWEAVLMDMGFTNSSVCGADIFYYTNWALGIDEIYYDTPSNLDDFFLIVEGKSNETISEFKCSTIAFARPLVQFPAAPEGRDDRKIPVSAKITVNTDYVPFLSQDFWYGLARHEIGHTLGFIGFFLNRGLGWSNGNVPDTSVNVQAAWDAICGADVGASSPPYTTDGGSHWISDCVQNEIMGEFTNDDFRPLSNLTLAAFRDLGYKVRDETYADDFSLDASLSKCGEFCPGYNTGAGFPATRYKQENPPAPFANCPINYPAKGSNKEFGIANGGGRKARKLLTSKGRRIPDYVIATADKELSKQKSSNNGKRSANAWVSITYFGEGGHVESETFTHDDFEDIPMEDESGKEEGARFLRATGP